MNADPGPVPPDPYEVRLSALETRVQQLIMQAADDRAARARMAGRITDLEERLRYAETGAEYAEWWEDAR
jgi:hypothetical protein